MAPKRKHNSSSSSPEENLDLTNSNSEVYLLNSETNENQDDQPLPKKRRVKNDLSINDLEENRPSCSSSVQKSEDMTFDESIDASVVEKSPSILTLSSGHFEASVLDDTQFESNLDHIDCEPENQADLEAMDNTTSENTQMNQDTVFPEQTSGTEVDDIQKSTNLDISPGTDNFRASQTSRSGRKLMVCLYQKVNENSVPNQIMCLSNHTSCKTATDAKLLGASTSCIRKSLEEKCQPSINYLESTTNGTQITLEKQEDTTFAAPSGSEEETSSVICKASSSSLSQNSTSHRSPTASNPIEPISCLENDALALENGAKKETENCAKRKSSEDHLEVVKAQPTIDSLVLKSRLNLEKSHVSGRVYVCGQNNCGQLGFENISEVQRPVVLNTSSDIIDVKAGGMHSLILDENGIVYSFGSNDEGALGRDVNEKSEKLPFLIDLPGKAMKISAGDCHSACILEDGSVYAWGSFRNETGDIGLTSNGRAFKPTRLLPDMRAVDIASGNQHLVILTEKGQVFTLGAGDAGQLGRDTRDCIAPGEVFTNTKMPIKKIWTTSFSTFFQEAVTDKIYGFGLNNYHQVSSKIKDLVISSPQLISEMQDVKQIAGGLAHTIVLKHSGAVYCVGRFEYGRLGLGKMTSDVTELVLVSALSGIKINSIACDEPFTVAVSDDGKLYAWGGGYNYNLGTGSEDDCLLPVNIYDPDVRYILADAGGLHSIFLAHP